MALTDRKQTDSNPTERLQIGDLLKVDPDEGDIQLLECPFCRLNFEKAGIERPNHFEGNCPVYHDLDQCPYSNVEFEDWGLTPKQFYLDDGCPAYDAPLRTFKSE